MKKEKSCGAVIIHDGKVLLEHQTNNHWSFPKGHVEPGESEEQTALREVKEETGLDIVIDPTVRYAFSYIIDHKNLIPTANPSRQNLTDDIDKEVVLFLAHLQDPNQPPAKQDSEISELRWVPLAEVESTFDRKAWEEAWRFFQDKIK